MNMGILLKIAPNPSLIFQMKGNKNNGNNQKERRHLENRLLNSKRILKGEIPHPLLHKNPQFLQVGEGHEAESSRNKYEALEVEEVETMGSHEKGGNGGY
jgi:hypothetical protein